MTPSMLGETPEECLVRIEETLDFGMVDLAEKSMSIHGDHLASPEFSARVAQIRQRIADGRKYEREHGEGSLIRHDLQKVRQLLQFLKIAATL